MPRTAGPFVSASKGRQSHRSAADPPSMPSRARPSSACPWHRLFTACLTAGIKLRGPEGAQRLRATSASMSELDSEDRSSSNSGIAGGGDCDPYIAGRISCISYTGGLCIQIRRSGQGHGFLVRHQGSSAWDPIGASTTPRLPSSGNNAVAVRMPGLIASARARHLGSSASNAMSARAHWLPFEGLRSAWRDRASVLGEPRPAMSCRRRAVPRQEAPLVSRSREHSFNAEPPTVRCWRRPPPRLYLPTRPRVAWARCRKSEASSVTWRSPNHALSFGNGPS